MGRSGYKEPAWWGRALDCLWEIHLVVVQGKVEAVQDSQGAPSAAAQEEDSSQQVETENLLMLSDSLPAAEEGIHHH